jgi:predicted alpha/beta superfamily hydrolase/nicotinamidase-related amidase
MKKNLLPLLFMVMASVVVAQNAPKVSSGSCKRMENFQSQFVAPRNVDIWLPDGYTPSKKYAVVYMHDGQMLFDTAQAWNKQEWKVDETLSKLMREQKIEDCIVVGIWNNGMERISEYFPTKIFDQLDEKTQKYVSDKFCNGKGGRGDQYLKFVFTELKPYIDKNYSTVPDREHTFMVGSSMGGLISIYALCEYPDLVKGVACLSTAWLSMIEPGYAIPAATFEYLKKNLPPPAGHKIYMDYGTGESDKAYETTQSFVDLIAKGKGYGDQNYLSKVYEKDNHNEVAWSARFHFPMEFLMPKTVQQNNLPVKTALLIVDIQNFYFPGEGGPGLFHAEAASLAAKEVLQLFREQKQLVVHVRHKSKKGFEIHPNVAPLAEEKIITKEEVNSFQKTDLLDYLKNKGINRLVIIGMQTQMCLEGAVRAARDFGFECVVVSDACATRDVKFGDKTVKAEDVQTAILATLTDGRYAKVVDLKNFKENSAKYLFQKLE